MTIVARLRGARLRQAVAVRAAEYEAAPSSPEARAARSLDRFNAVWSHIRRHVPWYADLARDARLPVRFASWDEVLERLPVMDKATMREAGDRLADASRPPDTWKSTGGSTGEPVRFPAWADETDATDPDPWVGRGWYGIRPDSRLFLLWGHGHLLGTGLGGFVKGRMRLAKDRALGYCRASAYDLDRDALRDAGERLIRHRPEYVIGYSHALDAFARANADRADAFADLGMKAIIATSECFADPEDGPRRVAATLGAPTAMEYGSIEAHVIAHTHPSDGLFRVFDGNYVVEAREPGPRGGRKVRLFALYPRAFPLVRYDLGDEIEPIAGEPELGPTRFARVLGRTTDSVRLPDGETIHAGLFDEVLDERIARYQVVVPATPGEALRLHLVPAGSDDHASVLADVRERLGRIRPVLGAMPIDLADAPLLTPAGKSPTLYRAGRDAGHA